MKTPADPTRAQVPVPAVKPQEREPDAAMPGQTVSDWSYASVAPTAPPIVHEVLSSPGRPLDRATRTSMETHLGADFDRVRVHADDRAARSAEAVGAAAYSVGQDVVFGRGFYRPEQPGGRELLAHELEHTAQDAGGPVPADLRIGEPGDVAEHEATKASTRLRETGPRPDRGPERRPQRASRAPVLRRTLLGSLLGGAGGALGGALIGGLLGGPIGAIVGGVVGLVAGAIVGEVVSTRSRPLTQPEIDYAHEIYLESIDYSKITITRDSTLAVGAPRTIGNTIHLKSTPPWNHFRGDTLELTEKGRLDLIHEMGHVWQYQNGGLAYIPLSLISQIRAAVSSGDRGGAYDWRVAHQAGTPWEDWNPEQQARAIEDYNILLRKSQAGTATPAELHELSVLLPYIEMVRNRQGAPTFGTPTSYEGVGI